MSLSAFMTLFDTLFVGITSTLSEHVDAILKRAAVIVVGRTCLVVRPAGGFDSRVPILAIPRPLDASGRPLGPLSLEASHREEAYHAKPYVLPEDQGLAAATREVDLLAEWMALGGDGPDPVAPAPSQAASDRLRDGAAAQPPLTSAAEAFWECLGIVDANRGT